MRLLKIAIIITLLYLSNQKTVIEFIFWNLKEATAIDKQLLKLCVFHNRKLSRNSAVCIGTKNNYFLCAGNICRNHYCLLDRMCQSYVRRYEKKQNYTYITLFFFKSLLQVLKLVLNWSKNNKHNEMTLWVVLCRLSDPLFLNWTDSDLSKVRVWSVYRSVIFWSQ